MTSNTPYEQQIVAVCEQELFTRCGVSVNVENGDSPVVKFTYHHAHFQDGDRMYLSHVMRQYPNLIAELYCDKPFDIRRRTREFSELENLKEWVAAKIPNPYTLLTPDHYCSISSSSLEAQKAAIESRLSDEIPPDRVGVYHQIHRSRLMHDEFHHLLLPNRDFNGVYEYLSLIYRDYYNHLQSRPIYQHEPPATLVPKLDIHLSNRQAYSWLIYPALHGLAQIMARGIDTYLSYLTPTRIKDLSEPLHIHQQPANKQSLVNRPKDVENVTVIFATSGTGKTKAISDLLNQEFGYYILAGNINPQSDSSPYETRRAEPNDSLHGSKDTWTLRCMLDAEIPFSHSKVLTDSSVFDALPFVRIKAARRLLLDDFLNKLSDASLMQVDGLPSRWFRFQTNCSNFDPFDDVFQLLASMPHSYHLHSWHRFQKYFDTRGHFDSDMALGPVMNICIDEAQADIQVYVKSAKTTVNLLVSMIDAMADSGDASLVVASTSMNIKSVSKAVEDYPVGRQTNHFLHLPTIRKQAEFTALLLQRDPELYSRIDKPLLPLVMGESSRFYGRYRWSVTYISHLRKQLENHGALSRDLVVEAADRAYKEAKEGLKSHLRKIQNKNDPSSMHLVNDILPTAAIWSHILDQSYIFENTERLTLVELGFASVDRQSDLSLKAKLSERIAVDAIIEGLGDGENDIIGRKLHQMLNFLQDDDGGFGTKAERQLIWELRKRLRCREDTDSLQGHNASYRNKLLGIFSGATNCQGESLGDVSKYFLLEGKKISYKPATATNTGSKKDKPGNVTHPWEWLASIRRGQVQSYSFLLPDEQVGPDIIMVLEKRDGKPRNSRRNLEDLILCFVQLKTGKSTLYGEKLNEALDTITPRSLYKAVETTKKRKVDESNKKNGSKSMTELEKLLGDLELRDSEKATVLEKMNELGRLTELEKKNELGKSSNLKTLSGFEKADLFEKMAESETVTELLSRKLRLDAEVLRWSKAKVLSVLVTTAQEARDAQPRHLEEGFFAWIDEKHTDDVFGAEFGNLLREMKE